MNLAFPPFACLGLVGLLSWGCGSTDTMATLDFVRATSDVRLRHDFAQAGYRLSAEADRDGHFLLARCVRETCASLPDGRGVRVRVVPAN